MSTKRVVDTAQAWKGRNFGEARYGAAPYCASFVRYVFETALGQRGELPIVFSPPYYRKLGLRIPVGKWYADSLAGEEVGRSLPGQPPQPGDLLFFKDTDRRYPPGTITHVGLCLTGGGLMADAGSGGWVHLRHPAQTLPGLLVEVRRPTCLAHGPVQQTTIALQHGQLQALLRGTRAARQEMHLRFANALHVAVNGKEVKPKAVTVDIALADHPPCVRLVVTSFAKL